MMEIPAPASLQRRGRWMPSHSFMRTKRTPSLSLTKSRIWMRTCSRRGSAAPLSLLRGCRSLHGEPLSQSVPPLVELKIDQRQKTELDPASKIAGPKLSQQGVIPAAFGATSVAPCLGGPSATQNAPTLTRVIPSRTNTASRARLVSGRLLFLKTALFSRLVDLFEPLQVLLGAVCH